MRDRQLQSGERRDERVGQATGATPSGRGDAWRCDVGTERGGELVCRRHTIGGELLERMHHRRLDVRRRTTAQAAERSRLVGQELCHDRLHGRSLNGGSPDSISYVTAPRA